MTTTVLRIERDVLDPESGHPDLDVEPLPTGEERYQRLVRIVHERAFATFVYDNRDGCLLVDIQTAHLLRRVADALSSTNRAKFLALDLRAMVATAWKLTT